jgi:hypothetical protein
MELAIVGLAALTVSFDCYLTTNVSCQDLEKAFFDANPFVAAAPADEADVKIETRAWQAPPSDEQYEVKFTGKGDLPKFQLPAAPLRLRSNLSSQSKIDVLRLNLVKGMAVFHKIEEYKMDPDGKLLISYSPTDGSAPPAPREESPWYGSIGGGATLVGQGSTMVSIFAGGEVGLSTPLWLLGMGGGAKFDYLEMPTQGGTQKGSNLSVGVGTIVARSIAKHWSVMAFVRGSRDPSSNWDSRLQAHTGIEYELIPFRESNDNTFTVSYVVGGNYENYVTPNIYDREEQLLATHALTLYYVKHLAALDLSGSAAVTTVVDDPKLYAVGGRASAKIYITRSLALDVGGGLGYKHNLVNAPKDPNAINPLLSVVGAGSAVTPLTYDVRLMVDFRWGNNLRRQKDTRWQLKPNDIPINF